MLKSFDELSKERNFTHDYETEFKLPEGYTPLPLKPTNQMFFLVSFCHSNHRPVHKQPGFKILGAFPDLRSASRHSDTYYNSGAEATFVIPAHQFIVIRQRFIDQQSESNITIINKILELHEDALNLGNADFKRAIDQATGGTPHISVEHLIKEAKEKVVTLNDAQDITSGMMVNAEISGQRYSVVITLNDIRPERIDGLQVPEPLIAILYTGETIEDCSNYIKYTAYKVYRDCNMRVVDNYKYLFPEQITQKDIGTLLYPNKNLNAIMNTRRLTDQTIQAYEESKSDKKVENIYIDLDAPSKP